jgi:hypothetical protein
VLIAISFDLARVYVLATSQTVMLSYVVKVYFDSQFISGRALQNDIAKSAVIT